MYLRFKLFNRRIVFYLRKVSMIEGVNSNLKNDKHIIMIECDGINIITLMNEISRLQQLFHLGHATILSSGRKNSYHIYIWSKVTWREAITVVAMCKYVDLKYLHWSLVRGHFTLRISDKVGRPIKKMFNITSLFPTTANYKDLESFVLYETASRLQKDYVKQLG